MPEDEVPKCNVHYDTPAALSTFVPSAVTDDEVAIELALNAKGCDYCKVRHLCQPEPEVVKGSVTVDGNSIQGNTGVYVHPGIERLIAAGINIDASRYE